MNVREGIESLSDEEFGTWLYEKGFHEDLVSSFVSQRISGNAFLLLSEDDLKELVPTIGDRSVVRDLLNKCKAVSTPPGLSSNEARSSSTESGSAGPSTTSNSSTVDRRSGSSTQAHHCTNAAASEWHLNFMIPQDTAFTSCVQQAIKTGVITTKARREIISVLHTYVVSNTVYPTSDQYNTVCRKLVAKFPNLVDREQGKSTIGSWKLGLRNALKNFRKDYPKKKGIATDDHATAVPPLKRCKLYCDDEGYIDDEEYEEALDELRTHGPPKKGGNHKEVKRLMELTKLRRHKWIREESPLVFEVVNKFPYLATSKWTRREFKSVVSFDLDIQSILDTWSDCCCRLISLSKLEYSTRSVLKKILDKLEDCETGDDVYDLCCLELLYRQLYPRGAKKNNVFIQRFETCDIDVDGEVSKIQQSEPYLVMTGSPDDENCQFLVCCEQALYMESESVKDAIIDLISTYYAYNISYPKPLNAIYIFLQHYIFEMTDEQPVPPATMKLVGNLRRINDSQ